MIIVYPAVDMNVRGLSNVMANHLVVVETFHISISEAKNI